MGRVARARSLVAVPSGSGRMEYVRAGRRPVWL